MRRRSFLLGLAALLISAGTVEARMHAPYRGHRIVAASSAPLDGFTTPTGAYSFRKLRSAYVGSAVKLQRVDTTTADIGFVGSDFDTAAAAAFCTTACTINTWYDQSGNSRHLVQATAANQPAYVASCIGLKPCGQSPAATQILNTVPLFTPATGVASMSVVAMRNAAAVGCIWMHENGSFQRFNAAAGLNTWSSLGSAGFINAAATDTVWHAGIAVVNGASSLVRIDSTETTGTTTGNTTAGVIRAMGGGAGSICSQTEAVFWDNYVLTPAERTALADNQKNYWLPYTLDAFIQPTGAYSFRRLKSTYTGPAIRIRRASDNAETDINFLGFVPGLGAPWDEAAALAHCNATSCFIRTLYDQSGNARDLAQAVTANQPQLVFNCNGALPCMRFTAATHVLASASFTPATGVGTLSVVANRSSGTAICTLLRTNGSGATGQRWTTANATQNWTISGGTSGSASRAATDAAWHSGVVVVNAASSLIGIDGAETTGTVTGSITAGPISIIGAAATTCDIAEPIYWDAYSLTAGERTALQINQKSFWGTP